MSNHKCMQSVLENPSHAHMNIQNLNAHMNIQILMNIQISYAVFGISSDFGHVSNSSRSAVAAELLCS